MRKLLLVRPEPGLSASAERAAALGFDVIACPLFRIEPVGWSVPNAADFDALLLTSGNALRWGGPGLDQLRTLPVHAVGAATASAAREAGFRVERVGEGDVDALLESLPRGLRLLHLAGEDWREPAGGHAVDRRIVYRAAAIERPGLPPLERLVAAIHSPRAGSRLAELAHVRHRTVIAAISAAAAEACGSGWERVEVADLPSDPSLLALAARLCQISDE